MIQLENIFPGWTVEKQIGHGSFGVVYQIVHVDEQGKGFRSALKVISIPQDPYELEMLRADGMDMNASRNYIKGVVDEAVGEIRMMESLQGYVPNIVRIEDYQVVEKSGEIGWDIYIRMELLTSFNAYISDKKISEEEVVRLGCEICSALEICEHRHIIHRDIKPENIFVSENGTFKLGDFGTARTMESVTRSLSQKGTYNYMAPEVIHGDPYDARVDIYSLGLVLYRLMNGNRLPFLSEKQLLSPSERRDAFARRIRGDALPKPAEASEHLAEVIQRACAFRPEDRFQNAAQMRAALLGMDVEESGTGNLSGDMLRCNFSEEYEDPRKTAQDDMGRPEKKKKGLPTMFYLVIIALILIGRGVFWLWANGQRNAAPNVVETAPIVENTVEDTTETPIAAESVQGANETLVKTSQPVYLFGYPTIELTTLVDEETGDGLNEYGEPVNWVIQIGFDVPESVALEERSLDITYTSINPNYGAADYALAQSGIMTYDYTIVPPGEGSEHWRYVCNIYLPDDEEPSHWGNALVSMGTETLDVQFELTYLGSYQNTLGWELKCVDQIYVASGAIFDRLNVTMERMNDGLPHSSSDRTGEDVYWVMKLEFDGHSLWIDRGIVPRVQWKGRPLTQHEADFQLARDGITTFDYVVLASEETKNVECRYAVYIYLADDPHLEGTNSITLTMDGEAKTVFFDLLYYGDYASGLGWGLQNVHS